MKGIQYSALEAKDQSPFETLLELFKEIIVHTSGDVEEALDWLRQLDEHYKITNETYTFDDFVNDLKERGYIATDPKKGGTPTLTPKGEAGVRKRAMSALFSNLKKGERGQHKTRAAGNQGESLGDLRAYQFGDALDKIVMNESLKNALGATGLDGFQLTQDHLVVEDASFTTSMSTVLMIDISHSMILYGEDRITPAKMVALALAEWITTQFPKDTLDIIVYGNDSWPISIQELPYLQVGPYHTNTVAGLELALDLLKKKRTTNKQIFNITDGKPSCLVEADGSYYKNSFGLDPYIVGKCHTMAAKAKRAQVPIHTFMVARDQYLQHFVQSFTEINGGKAYYTGLNKLGEMIFSDYQANKKKRSR